MVDVPQGSVLGPLLFTMHTVTLGQMLQDLRVMYHLYADDTQLYITFKLSQCANEVGKMKHCILIIREWMANHFLKLNGDKTELLVLGSPQMINNLILPTLHIGR